MRTFREKFEEFYNSLYECQQWQIINEYADENNFERVYDMDEFNEVMSGFSPLDIARLANVNDFNSNDKYFHFDGQANLQSSNNCCEWTDFDAMADWYEWHDHILLRIDREEWEALEEEEEEEE